MKIGIIIGRMQPIHLGHIQLITKSIQDNDLTLIILGSSGKHDENNIFSDVGRRHFINLSLTTNIKYKVLFLKDTITDREWCKNLNKLIHINMWEYLEKTTFYCGDRKNDYAIQVIEKFREVFFMKNSYIIELPRKKLIIEHLGLKYTISSTQIREAIKDKNIELIKKMLHPKVSQLILSTIK